MGSNSNLSTPCGTQNSLYTQFASLEAKRELGRVNYRKDFWDCYWEWGKNWPIAVRRIPSNDPRSLCESYGNSTHSINDIT